MNIIYNNLNPDMVKQARGFCLEVIKEVYGIDYRADYHSDLDDLLNSDGVYTARKGGAFLVAELDNQIIGTIGVRTLEGKDQLLEKFKDKGYGVGKKIASIWRTYVKKDFRGKGIGKELLELAEEFIIKAGYRTIYLHTSNSNPDAVAFWQKRGYKIILEEEDKTVHMEKSLYLDRVR